MQFRKSFVLIFLLQINFTLDFHLVPFLMGGLESPIKRHLMKMLSKFQVKKQGNTLMRYLSSTYHTNTAVRLCAILWLVLDYKEDKKDQLRMSFK